MRHRTPSARRAGMTLVELMVAVSVLAVGTSIAIPRITSIRDQLTLEAAAQELVHQLNLTRSEAIKRNQPTSFYRRSASTFQVGTLTARALPGHVTFASGAPDSVRYASFGPPVTGAVTIPLQVGARTRVVRINAAGYASF
jgi:prepilin-type N-terminal cleavage/methylation domain-containing protein